MIDPFSYEDHPIDNIEPINEDETRDFARHLLAHNNRVLEWIINAQNPHLAAWAVAYATNWIGCTKSMSEQGKILGFGYAAISKVARDFCETYNLPPSKWMKSQQYVDARREQATPNE